jgi:LemA protein
VRFDSKIEQMLAQGKVTPEQAAALKSSLSGSHSPAPSMHAPLPAKTLIAAMAGVTLIAIIMLASGGDSTDIQTIQDVSETLNQSGKVGEMNKSLSSVISVMLIGLPVIGSLIWFALSYNGLVSKEETVLSSWAQVESNYQRRADLIPNLVNTVKAFTEHEQETLTDIARLRSQIDTVQQENAKVKEISQGAAAHLNDEAYMASLAQAQQGLSGQLKGLMMTVESYPTLRSSDQYMELQAQLEGTENRINVARMAFNEAVNQFNASIRKMPGSLIAGMGDFQRKAYFKADAGSQDAPTVSFDTNQKAAE